MRRSAALCTTLCTALLMMTAAGAPAAGASREPGPSGEPVAAGTGEPAAADRWIELSDLPMIVEEAAGDPDPSEVASEPTGFDLAELVAPATAASCPPGGTATFTWKITDGCSDGRGLYVRFFDVTNDLVWPNATQAYTISPGRSATLKLSVRRGARICYGAEPNPRNGRYWGLGLDRQFGCSACCNVVPSSGNLSRSVRLVC